MDARMLASFTDELMKLAAGNVISSDKPEVGGMGSNIVGKPLPSTGIAKGTSSARPKPAQTTNYTMVHSDAPLAAVDAGASTKSVPPPLVRT
jgi:hypothetical protein